MVVAKSSRGKKEHVSQINDYTQSGLIEKALPAQKQCGTNLAKWAQPVSFLKFMVGHHDLSTLLMSQTVEGEGDGVHSQGTHCLLTVVISHTPSGTYFIFIISVTESQRLPRNMVSCHSSCFSCSTHSTRGWSCFRISVSFSDCPQDWYRRVTWISVLNWCSSGVLPQVPQWSRVKSLKFDLASESYVLKFFEFVQIWYCSASRGKGLHTNLLLL